MLRTPFHPIAPPPSQRDSSFFYSIMHRGLAQHRHRTDAKRAPPTSDSAWTNRPDAKRAHWSIDRTRNGAHGPIKWTRNERIGQLSRRETDALTNRPDAKRSEKNSAKEKGPREEMPRDAADPFARKKTAKRTHVKKLTRYKGPGGVKRRKFRKVEIE